MARAWIGCIACYNAGRFRGEWVDAEVAADYQPCPIPSHEEAWAYDVEGPYLKGEMSPMQVTRTAEAADQFAPWPSDAVEAWLGDKGIGIADADPDDFEEEYFGFWPSGAEFAESWAANTCCCSEMSRMLRDDWPWSYIDWDRAWRDHGGFWSAPSADGGVHVFAIR
jgi:hypothetical protein